MPEEAVRLLAIALFFFLPGWLVMRALRWHHRVGPLGWLPVAFALSIASGYPAALIVFLLTPTTTHALMVQVVLLYAPAAALLLLRRQPLPETPSLNSGRPHWGWPALAFLPVVLLLAAVWPFRMDINTSYDTGYFLTIARQFAESESVVLPSAHVGGNIVDRAYGLNAYLLTVGLLARLLRQDVLLVWGSLCVYGLAAFILATCLCAARLFGSSRVGLAVMAFVVLYRFSGYFAFPPCVYANPSMVTRCLALVLIWMFTELHRHPSRLNRLVFGITGAALLAVHPFGVILVMCYLAGLFIMAALFERGRERGRLLRGTAGAAATLMLLAGPYVLMRLSQNGAKTGPLFSARWEDQPPNVQRFLMQVWDSYISRPSLVLYGHPWAACGGVVLLIALYRCRTSVRRVDLHMLVGGTIVIALVALNPWVLPVAARYLTVDQLARLARVNPVHGIALLGASGVVISLVLNSTPNVRLRSGLGCILAAGVGVFCLRRIQDVRQDLSRAAARRQNPPPYYVNARKVPNDRFIQTLRRAVPHGTAVLNTDPRVEIGLCPLVGVRVYDLFKVNWASMNLDWPEHLSRQAVIRDFMAAPGPFTRWRVLRSTGLRYAATLNTVSLPEPYFTLVAGTDRSLGLAVYRRADRDEIRRIASDWLDQYRTAIKDHDTYRTWYFHRLFQSLAGSLEIDEQLAEIQSRLPPPRTTAAARHLHDLVAADLLAPSQDLSVLLDASVAAGLVQRILSTIGPGSAVRSVVLTPNPDAGVPDYARTLFDADRPITGRGWINSGVKWNQTPFAHIRVSLKNRQVISGIRVVSHPNVAGYGPATVSIHVRDADHVPWVTVVADDPWTEGRNAWTADQILWPAGEVCITLRSSARTPMLVTDIELQFLQDR